MATMKNEEGLPSPQILIEEKDVPTNERALEESSISHQILDDVAKSYLSNWNPPCSGVEVSMYFMLLLYICNSSYAKHELLLRINAHAPIQVARPTIWQEKRTVVSI
jgi:hypothetical protein